LACYPRLEGFITGKNKAPVQEIEERDGDKKILAPNLEYEDWLAGDQQVFSFILASIPKEILIRIATTETVAEAGRTIHLSDSCLHYQHEDGARKYSQGNYVCC
jgi:hypothetical protein